MVRAVSSRRNALCGAYSLYNGRWNPYAAYRMQSLEEKINWLVDRAQISDLLFSFARALDTRDYAAYVANYAADGCIDLPQPAGGPDARLRMSRDEMLTRVPKSFLNYTATHHLSANHQITIEGDRATSRSYVVAVHVRNSPRDHWDAGGWYDCVYRRTAAGWKFVEVKLTAVYLDGAPEAI